MKSPLEELTIAPDELAKLTPGALVELTWRLAELPVFADPSRSMIVRPDGGGCSRKFGLAKFIERALLAGKPAQTIVDSANLQIGRNAYEAFEAAPVQGIDLTARHELPGGGYMIPLHGEAAETVLGRSLASEFYELGWREDRVAFVQPVMVQPALVGDDDLEALRPDRRVAERRHRRRVLECALALVVPTTVSLRGWSSFVAPDSIYDVGPVKVSAGRYFKPIVIPTMLDVNALDEVIRDIDGFDPLQADKLLLAAERLVRSRAYWLQADRALDLGIAQEMLLTDENDDRYRISRRIRDRSAWLLGTDAASWKARSEGAKELYLLRSDAAHVGLISSERFETPEAVESALRDADALVVATLRAVLARGRFPDWKAVGV